MMRALTHPAQHDPPYARETVRSRFFMAWYLLDFTCLIPWRDVLQSLHLGPLVVLITRFDFKTPPGVRVEADLCDRVL